MYGFTRKCRLDQHMHNHAKKMHAGNYIHHNINSQKYQEGSHDTTILAQPLRKTC